MKHYSNFITFRIGEISENTFSLASRLIETIENEKSYTTINELLQEKNYSKVRYVRKENVNLLNKETARIGEQSKELLCNHLTDFKEALNNNEKIFYIFFYNKNESIRSCLTSLKYFFLIKQTYTNCILIIDDKYTKENEYYIISHFLYFETLKEKYSVLYKNQGKGSYQSLQLNNIGALTQFIPLIEINLETYYMLAMRISELWDDSNHLNIKSNSIFNKIWESCMEFMNRKQEDNTIYFKEMDEYKGLSFLAFYILQLYIFNNKKNARNIDDKTLRFFVLEVTDGILQLLENICLHTELKKGYLSIIINKEENCELKVEIIDYAKSNNKLKEISVLNHKFIENLKEGDNLKKYFRYAQVKDFFEPEFVENVDLSEENFYGNYWEEYYKRPENAAFHYGLQMFASVVKGYLGNFYVRSSYTYTSLPNQKHFFGKESIEMNEQIYNFPGTYYMINFPMQIENVQKNIGFNSKISDQAFKDILRYSVETISEKYYHKLINMLSLERTSQLEKEKRIREIKEFIKNIDQYFRNDKYFITRIPFEEFISGQMMEYFCKALFLFIKELKDIKLKIAITGCSEECMLEFVRWFLIFYDKYNNCEEMKNVEIYLVGTDCREDFLLSGTSLAISQGRVEKVCMSKGVFNQRQRIISQAVWRAVEDKSHFDDDGYEIIPYDVIVENKKGEKIFENAVLKTLDTNLQSQEFGCKVENCHVRIGSKIHITDNFYEAHSLFHSNYYTSRFAFLLAQKMINNLIEEKQKDFFDKLKEKQLILVGYETYSELLICEIKKILKNSFGFAKVDHIVFDTANADEFRMWNEKCINAYYVNIVPINSTLSTHNKMISLYKGYEMDEDRILANYAMILIRDREYTKDGQRKRIKIGNFNNKNIFNNLSDLENKYWDGLDSVNKKVYTPLVKREVDYIILIENNWNSPLECECCYPDDIKQETPLIETNKASVVPTFMIGMRQEDCNFQKQSLIDVYNKTVNDERISQEIMDYSVLTYAHIYRNGNDYRFYINSENLYKKIEICRKSDIDTWCKNVKTILKHKAPKLYLSDLINAFLKKRDGRSVVLFNEFLKELNNMPEDLQLDEALNFLHTLEQKIRENKLTQKTEYYESIKITEVKVKKISQQQEIQTYDIIVSPVHHSNATWIDQVTETVFENMPAILHFDVQKEFRDNMKTKYSNLTTLYHNLCSAERKFEINFHYVDDTIISGKTFNRAKTLIQSLFPMEAYSSQNGEKPKVNLFKSVILLFNRLSNSSKLFYVAQGMFFSYINIYVPNLRNHEDACIMCKLVSDMKKVKRRSATNLLAELFERKEIKHLRIDEMQYDKVGDEEKKKLEKKNYKRLYCNHKIFEKIGEIGAVRNESNILRKVMLELINEKICQDNLTYEERMEWLISYFKIYSRPVVTFRKSFLEAYFSIAINFMELLQENECDEEDMELISSFYNGFIEKGEKKSQLLDAVIKAVLGGLGRVKSNYIMRAPQIIKIFEWYDRNVSQADIEKYNNFQIWYIFNLKRLIELSGDETKCLWLEKMLLEGVEWRNNRKYENFEQIFGMQTSFGRYLYIENTRLIYDAISDLNKNFYSGKNENILKKEIEEQLKNNPANFTHYYVDNFFKLVKINLDFCNEKQQSSYESKCINRIVNMVKMYNHLNKGLEENGEKPNISEVISINDEYVELLNYMQRASEAKKVFLFGADKQEDRLKFVKEYILEGCKKEKISEDIKAVLTEDTVRLKLYHITNSEEEKFDEKYNSDKKHKSDKKYKYDNKKEFLYAAELLQGFEFENPDLVCIGKTIIINLKTHRALVKIHNNWDELREKCQKKNINKIHVDPFYFYFDFSDHTENEILRGLRNVLTFRDSLVKKIEEDFNNNLIQLTVSSQKQANDLSNDRAAGHTKKDEIGGLMGVFIKNNSNFESGKEEISYNNIYNEKDTLGSMLKLLADSYCSHKFREYYSKASKPLSPKDLVTGLSLKGYEKDIGKYKNVFTSCIFKTISSDSKSPIQADVNFEDTEADTKVLCIGSEEIWVLFIVLLIQNALNHGMVENGKVSVRIYIQDKYLIVENKIMSSKSNAENINKMLERVPEKAEGISLWVIDQCIRDTWRKYYLKMYAEYDQKDNKLNTPMQNISMLIDKLKDLEKCVICAEQNEKGDVLKIKLPIIIKKEEQYENIMV